MVMPVLTLLWLELRFLPYQSYWITGWHVVLAALDVIMIWVMWREVMQLPAGSDTKKRSSCRRWVRLGHVAAVLAVAASVALLLAPEFPSSFPILGWAPW